MAEEDLGLGGAESVTMPRVDVNTLQFNDQPFELNDPYLALKIFKLWRFTGGASFIHPKTQQLLSEMLTRAQWVIDDDEWDLAASASRQVSAAEQVVHGMNLEEAKLLVLLINYDIFLAENSLLAGKVKKPTQFVLDLLRNRSYFNGYELGRLYRQTGYQFSNSQQETLANLHILFGIMEVEKQASVLEQSFEAKLFAVYAKAIRERASEAYIGSPAQNEDFMQFLEMQAEKLIAEDSSFPRMFQLIKTEIEKVFAEEGSLVSEEKREKLCELLSEQLERTIQVIASLLDEQSEAIPSLKALILTFKEHKAADFSANKTQWLEHCQAAMNALKQLPSEKIAPIAPYLYEFGLLSQTVAEVADQNQKLDNGYLLCQRMSDLVMQHLFEKGIFQDLLQDWQAQAAGTIAEEINAFVSSQFGQQAAANAGLVLNSALVAKDPMIFPKYGKYQFIPSNGVSLTQFHFSFRSGEPIAIRVAIAFEEGVCEYDGEFKRFYVNQRDEVCIIPEEQHSEFMLNKPADLKPLSQLQLTYQLHRDPEAASGFTLVPDMTPGAMQLSLSSAFVLSESASHVLDGGDYQRSLRLPGDEEVLVDDPELTLKTWAPFNSAEGVLSESGMKALVALREQNKQGLLSMRKNTKQSRLMCLASHGLMMRCEKGSLTTPGQWLRDVTRNFSLNGQVYAARSGSILATLPMCNQLFAKFALLKIELSVERFDEKIKLSPDFGAYKAVLCNLLDNQLNKFSDPNYSMQDAAREIKHNFNGPALQEMLALAAVNPEDAEVRDEDVVRGFFRFVDREVYSRLKTDRSQFIIDNLGQKASIELMKQVSGLLEIKAGKLANSKLKALPLDAYQQAIDYDVAGNCYVKLTASSSRANLTVKEEPALMGYVQGSEGAEMKVISICDPKVVSLQQRQASAAESLPALVKYEFVFKLEQLPNSPAGRTRFTLLPIPDQCKVEHLDPMLQLSALAKSVFEIGYSNTLAKQRASASSSGHGRILKQMMRATRKGTKGRTSPTSSVEEELDYSLLQLSGDEDDEDDEDAADEQTASASRSPRPMAAADKEEVKGGGRSASPRNTATFFEEADRYGEPTNTDVPPPAAPPASSQANPPEAAEVNARRPSSSGKVS